MLRNKSVFCSYTANSASCFHTLASVSYSNRKWLMGTEPDTAIPATAKSYTHGEGEKDVSNAVFTKLPDVWNP